MSSYIHELTDWPKFHWSEDKLASQLARVRYRQGRLIGRMEGLGFQLKAEAVLQTLTEEISQIQRNRGGSPRQGTSAFIDCTSPRN